MKSVLILIVSLFLIACAGQSERPKGPMTQLSTGVVALMEDEPDLRIDDPPDKLYHPQSNRNPSWNTDLFYSSGN